MKKPLGAEGALYSSRRNALRIPLRLRCTAIEEPLYPHPYFGRKILVFMSLQTVLRCKIVKTKELPAKSPRIRS
jgi:hypothetical protein